jgi:hypothetical protein
MVRINSFARADHVFPPARLVIVCRIIARCMAVSGQGVEDQHHVAAVRIQGAVGLVGQGNGPEPCAAVKGHFVGWLSKGEKLLFHNAHGPAGLVMGDVFTHFRGFLLVL